MIALSRRAARTSFLFLLPLFFVLHGYSQNQEAMTAWEAVGLLGKYIAITAVLFGCCYLLFNTVQKAALYAFSLLFFYLFFGALHDGLKGLSPGSFLSKYWFVLLLAAAFFAALFIFLRKTKNNFHRLITYFNLLLVLLLVFEIAGLLRPPDNSNKTMFVASASVCDTCQKPDIYLIIADAYADSVSLQQLFQFNNTAFQTALRRRGFHLVNNSRSNYNFTPFSMASLLQMNYLRGIEGRNQSLADKNKCYNWINKAPLFDFLKQHGYEIRNNSMFNVADIPTPAPQNYIRIGADMIENQTLLSRLNRDLRFHLVTTLRLQGQIEQFTYFMHYCNQLLLSRLLADVKDSASRPRFIYTHLTMPHYPYYYQANGRPNPPEKLREENQGPEDYIEYLQWTNGLLLETIDRILTAAKEPPVILLMSDHGFREFTGDFEKNAPYYFMNLNAVLLPNGNYQKFYDGMSSVNQFRVLLNTTFGQQLPLLKDSSILLYE
jgi:hypothetical protein